MRSRVRTPSRKRTVPWMLPARRVVFHLGMNPAQPLRGTFPHGCRHLDLGESTRGCKRPAPEETFGISGVGATNRCSGKRSRLLLPLWGAAVRRSLSQRVHASTHIYPNITKWKRHIVLLNHYPREADCFPLGIPVLA